MLSEAPGHLFLDYEDSDLITFLQMAITSGWDAEVIPELRYGAAGDARVFVSHDEFVVMAHRNDAMLDAWREDLQAWRPPSPCKASP